MTRIENEIEINAPVEKVYEYYTNPDNIKAAWPSDVVKESETTSGEKNEEGSEMKVRGQYMGTQQEMTLEVTDKEPNRRLVARQTQGPFKSLESVQEFQGTGNTTRVKHTINYELPTGGKVANLLTGSQADDKFRQGMQQAAETVKKRLEQ